MSLNMTMTATSTSPSPPPTLKLHEAVAPAQPQQLDAADTAARMEFPRLSRRYRLQYEQVQSAWVLLYPEGMVKLNDSAAEILRRCNGERSLASIVADLEILFNAKGIAPQVRDILQEGMHRGWIV